MAEQEAEEVKPTYEKRGQQIEDERSTAVKQSRWDAFLLAATGGINARDSPLLRLPAELRTKIYGYVLGYKYIYPNARHVNWGSGPYPPLLVCDCDGARDQRTHGRRIACWSQRLYYHLLCTCRQIYNEAFPIFWSTNTFCFEFGSVMPVILQNWLPHQKALIRKVRLDIGWFVLDAEWEEHLEGANLASLQSLEQIHIVTHSYFECDPPTGIPQERMQRRRSRLVKNIYKMLAGRPFLTMLVVRDELLLRRLGNTSRLGKLLERV